MRNFKADEMIQHKNSTSARGMGLDLVILEILFPRTTATCDTIMTQRVCVGDTVTVTATGAATVAESGKGTNRNSVPTEESYLETPIASPGFSSGRLSKTRDAR